MSLATTSEPKLFARPRVASAGELTIGSSATVSLRQAAENAVRQKHHDGDQQNADPEIPVLRLDAGKLVAGDHEDDGADQSAIKPAGAAEHEHDHHLGRALEAERIQRHGFGRLRQQRAGDPGDAGGDGVDGAQMRVAWRADRRHADMIFANAAQRQAERRMNDRRANRNTTNSTASA